MSATIVKFDPLVALHCRWNALHAECERLLNEGQSKAADAVSQSMVELKIVSQPWSRDHLLAPLCRFGFAARLQRVRVARAARRECRQAHMWPAADRRGTAMSAEIIKLQWQLRAVNHALLRTYRSLKPSEQRAFFDAVSRMADDGQSPGEFVIQMLIELGDTPQQACERVRKASIPCRSMAQQAGLMFDGSPAGDGGALFCHAIIPAEAH